MIIRLWTRGRERLNKSEKVELYAWARLSALQRLWFDDAISLAKIKVDTLRSLK